MVEAPKVAARARSRAISRPQPASRPATRRAAGSAPATSARALVDLSTQRVYHLTHVDNLASILESGMIFADAGADTEASPSVDISAPGIREARRAIRVGEADSPTVASYVPFSLSPKPAVWEALVSGVSDPRLSAVGAVSVPSDFVMLVTTIRQVLELDSTRGDAAGIVASNRDAVHPLSRFGVGVEQAQRIVRSVRADESSDALLEAELLVADGFPFDLVSLIGVANDKARDVVKGILRAGASSTKVAVYPPWFRPNEADTDAG